ncbi:MAG: hypothetical protein VR73_02955 [Gammaproteobacteria bacterium BRH_c0]|nr:MAG: hypothetical protein VR73_02955 [Gammaproteobacteria bacterium BRH_c0]
MATKKVKDPTITIDGTAYSLANLSDNAKAQIANLRYADAEIINLQNQLAIFRTARVSYAEQLKKELPTAP